MTEEEKKGVRDVLTAGWEEFLEAFPGELEAREQEFLRMAYVAGGAFAMGQFMAHLVETYEGMRDGLIAMHADAAPLLGVIERAGDGKVKA